MKLLYIAFYFAPDNTVSAIRTTKFAKYLPQFGVQPYVFTADRADVQSNPALLAQLPDNVVIHRKKCRIKSVPGFYSAETKIETGITKLKIALKDILFSPDKYIWWNLSLLPELINTIRREKIDIAMACGDPFSSFVTLIILKKLCGIPMVIDLRDPWKDNVCELKQSAFRRFSSAFWEKRCVEHADGVISVNDVIVDSLRKYQTAAKFLTLTNGFDLDDFKNIDAPQQAKDEFVFLYTGRYSIFKEDYNPTSVIDAFLNFLAQVPNKNIKLVFIGQTDNETLNYIDQLPGNNVQGLPSLPRDEFLNKQKQAHALIHFFYPQTHDAVFSMKMYEYMLHRKPILSFNVEEGLLHDYLVQHQLGASVDSHNIAGMTDAFLKTYQGRITFNDAFDVSNIERFDFRNLSQHLAEFLKELVTRNQQ
jgi:glycosyltransferase involved in cell wall biosynthesis